MRSETDVTKEAAGPPIHFGESEFRRAYEQGRNTTTITQGARQRFPGAPWEFFFGRAAIASALTRLPLAFD
jgi:hypothetical protein